MQVCVGKVQPSTLGMQSMWSSDAPKVLETVLDLGQCCQWVSARKANKVRSGR